ncbi:enoyl-ACP reductase FabI [Alicyclobacillus sp. SO9]|uniref:enoyl-ACP reductase FabI n=1 Tax=Alicyclobacillus sp. SO9 TaxID=2665646 RepID=UPI0018E71ADC|nr:enoyl-ACP reductase FabI [Alicyclobacillus sp. SO9]QQE80282.1 enoyl-ACP reductase FabI [Alicyclobacillus sp. SO9]
MSLLSGKTILVMGVANKRSIAWGIATSAYKQGARLAFTCLSEREKAKVESLVQEDMPGEEFPVVICNVAEDESLDAAFAELRTRVGVLHGVAHAVAFAKTEELQGEYADTSRDGYLLAQNISVYSLVGVARRARDLMTEGGSIVTLTYLGGERVVENYNVMGVAKAALDASMRYLAKDLGSQDIRVNAISSGPIRTVSAKGVHDFNKIVNTLAERAPLGRSTNQEEVGDVASFLFSNLGRGVTGEIIHVDGGFHILGF